MDDEPDAYQTYLLRLWRARCRGTWQWRAPLESRHTGKRQAFAGLGQLFAFLGERCEGEPQSVPSAGRLTEGPSSEPRDEFSAVRAGLG